MQSHPGHPTRDCIPRGGHGVVSPERSGGSVDRHLVDGVGVGVLGHVGADCLRVYQRRVVHLQGVGFRNTGV